MRQRVCVKEKDIYGDIYRKRVRVRKSVRKIMREKNDEVTRE